MPNLPFRALALALASSFAFPLSAAAVPVDEMLSIQREDRPFVDAFKFGAVASYESGISTSWRFYRGRIPINDEKFLDLLERKNVSLNFVNEAKGRAATYNWIMYGGSTFVTAAGTAAAIFGPSLFIKIDTSSTLGRIQYENAQAAWIAGGIVVALGGLIWMALTIRSHTRHFELTDAQDAINVYNAAP